MDNSGVVVPLPAQFPGRPNLSCHLVCDFSTKQLSLVLVDPSQPVNQRISVLEVQTYTQPGI